MREVIEDARLAQDSVGGVIEAAAIGLPVGLGEPMFDGLESKLAAILYAIPAVKGVEFGKGFAAAALMGSENNDPFYYDADGEDIYQSSWRKFGWNFQRNAFGIADCVQTDAFYFPGTADDWSGYPTK